MWVSASCGSTPATMNLSRSLAESQPAGSKVTSMPARGVGLVGGGMTVGGGWDDGWLRLGVVRVG